MGDDKEKKKPSPEEVIKGAKDTARVSIALMGISPSTVCSVLAYGVSILMNNSSEKELDAVLAKVREFQIGIPEGMQESSRQAYRMAVTMREMGMNIPLMGAIEVNEEKIRKDYGPGVPKEDEKFDPDKLTVNEIDEAFDNMVRSKDIEEITDEEVFIPVIKTPEDVIPTGDGKGEEVKE